MKTQRMRFKARGKVQEMRNAQFEKMTSGYIPRPKGMGLRNKHRQTPRGKAGK